MESVIIIGMILIFIYMLVRLIEKDKTTNIYTDILKDVLERRDDMWKSQTTTISPSFNNFDKEFTEKQKEIKKFREDINKTLNRADEPTVNVDTEGE